MKARISEISRISGFSPATVSNALNSKKGVNPETAEKILKIAQECGYFSKAKITHIKFVIFKNSGLVLSNAPFFDSLIAGVVNESKKNGYETTIVHLDKGAPDFQLNLHELLNDGKSAVLLLATEGTEEDIQMFRSVTCPLVVMDSWFEKATFNSVLIDNTESVFQAVKYMIQKGHREIGYLMSSVRIKNFVYRKRGYVQALMSSGLTQRKEYLFSLRPTMDGAYHDMEALLAKSPRLPTAFFAENDIVALGAMKALQKYGYRVPEDVSMIGFDDIQFCSISEPPLTTIRVFKEDMGRIAVNRLIELIRSESNVKTKITICTEFVERDSVRQL